MSSDEVRDVIAGLREGDEIEVTYRGVVTPESGGWFFGDDGYTRKFADATAVRVIKRAPLPEPPAGLVGRQVVGQRRGWRGLHLDPVGRARHREVLGVHGRRGPGCHTGR